MIQHKAPHRNWMPDIKNVTKFDNVTIPVPDNFFDDYATRAAHEQEMEIAKKLTINSGLSKNTIVVFTSDQEFYLGEHGWFDKRFMYEESLKTPLLIKYPNHIPKEWVCDKMVQNLDFAETILDYAGVAIPADMQGISMKPLLEKKVSKIRDDIYYHYYEFPAEHMVKKHYGIRTSRYKLIHFYYDCDEWELYDLKNDPKEMNNLYSKPAYQNVISTLKKRLKALQVQYKVPSIEEELKSIKVKI